MIIEISRANPGRRRDIVSGDAVRALLIKEFDGSRDDPRFGGGGLFARLFLHGVPSNKFRHICLNWINVFLNLDGALPYVSYTPKYRGLGSLSRALCVWISERSVGHRCRTRRGRCPRRRTDGGKGSGPGTGSRQRRSLPRAARTGGLRHLRGDGG